MTIAEIAQRRINEQMTELIFRREPIPDHVTPDWLRANVPSPIGNWTYLTPRPHIIATLVYDDGSHLDVLKGAVFAW